MADKTKRVTLRLLNDFIAANSANRGPHRLKGPIFARTKAIRRATELKALIRMAGDGREWKRSSVDTLTRELRDQAADTRLSCEIRIDALEKLCVLGGFLAPSVLSDDIVSQQIRQIIAPTVEKPATPAPSTGTTNADLLDFSNVGRRG
jgi:hypothetical protein